MAEKVPTGAVLLDKLLEGGFETDAITTIYGTAGSGKTNLCILAAVQTAQRNKKILYIDTEGSFSVERLKQISPNYKTILENITFLNPTTFEEQKRIFEKLNEHLADQVALIIFDSVALLYRLEIGKANDIYAVNRELGLQIGILSQLARNKNIPVLITNQVYADLNDENTVRMVGGDLLKYQSKCLLELQKVPNTVMRKVLLRKHRSLPETRTAKFYIVNSGVIEVEKNNS